LPVVGGTGGHQQDAAGKATARRTAPAANRLARTPPRFRAVGTVNGNDNFLTCVTASICYIGGASDGGGIEDVARTLNGGATWTSGEPLPSLGSSYSFDWNAPLSCPGPMTCYSAYGPGIMETTDGFAHYRYVPVTLPPDMPSSLYIAELVSCATRLHCVADVTLQNNNDALIYSDNGGATWAAATAPNFNRNDNEIGELQCDPGGACIAAISGGDETNPTVSALASTNGGRSWTMSGTFADPGLQEWSVSCPDGRDCLFSGAGTDLAWIHVTAGGHISIRVQPFPAGWDTGVTASCATASDCFVETEAPAIEATRDGGRTWTSIPLNMPEPGEIGDYLSCPVPAGCLVVGNSASASNAVVVLSNLHDGR
jgi:hypothetical protein